MWKGRGPFSLHHTMDITSCLSIFRMVESPFVHKCRSKDILMFWWCQRITRFSSFIQDKNPRNSRYMIKIISRVLGRKFQVETARGLAKEFKLKCFYKRFTRGCNRLPMAKMLPKMLLKCSWILLKACNRLHKSCNKLLAVETIYNSY